MHFPDAVIEAADRTAPCIVGLDPDLSLMPRAFRDRSHDAQSLSDLCAIVRDFNYLVLESVHDLVPVIKPQSAFYERFGPEGVAVLASTITRARDLGLLVLLDAKRGDIGSTAEAYAAAYMSDIDPAGGKNALQVDAITLNPYLGRDSLAPFFRRCEDGEHGVFVCVKTSNPGAGDLQDLSSAGEEIFRHVAGWIRAAYANQDRGKYGYCGLGAVVGATYPSDAEALRELLPQSLFLVPGYGAQGGDPGKLRAFFDESGHGALVAASRSIMYPAGASEATDVAEVTAAIREAAESFVDTVKKAVS